MAEIVSGKFIRNETNQSSWGGTERMVQTVAERCDPELLNEFQIVASRKRELHNDKIRIFWAHDLPGDPESEFLNDENNHELFHKFVFVSHWQMEQYHNRYRIPLSQCAVIQNAIDPIVPDKSDHDTIKLIYTSTPHRGLNILVPVVDALVKNHPNIHLDVYSSFEIYGWKKRDDEFANLFEQIEQHPNMTHHGARPNKEVRDAVSKADIFTYPSVWKETSCLSLMEAMSAGCVCIHPNYAALPETAANWTTMYQMQDRLHDHANVFAAVLNSQLEAITHQGRPNHSSMSSYANAFYSWSLRAVQWNAFLRYLLNSVDDRSLPEPSITYRTT